MVVNLRARRGSESVARSCRAELPEARVLASRSLEEALGFARDLRESPPELLLSAGYAPEGDRNAMPPMMEVGKEFFPDAVYEPTLDELRVINEANAEQIFFGPLTEPGFWNDPADERRAAFRYLEGLIDEARRFKRRHKAEH